MQRGGQRRRHSGNTEPSRLWRNRKRAGRLQKVGMLPTNPRATVSSTGGAGADAVRCRAPPIRIQSCALRVPGHAEDGSSAAAGALAAQPAAGGAPLRVAAHPSCSAAHRLRTAAGPAARPGRGPAPARPRGWARGLPGPPRCAFQRHLHSGATSRPAGTPRATTR